MFIADGDAILFLKYVGSGGREMDQAVAKHLELELPEAMRLRASVTNSAVLDSQSDVHRSVIEAIRPQLRDAAQGKASTAFGMLSHLAKPVNASAASKAKRRYLEKRYAAKQVTPSK